MPIPAFMLAAGAAASRMLPHLIRGGRMFRRSRFHGRPLVRRSHVRRAHKWAKSKWTFNAYTATASFTLFSPFTAHPQYVVGEKLFSKAFPRKPRYSGRVRFVRRL